MKQSEEHKGSKRAERRKTRRKALLFCRIGAGVLVVLAVALAVYTSKVGLSPAALMWGSACGLLVALALTLAVDLPVSRLLQGALGVCCIALLAFGYLNHNFVRVEGKLVPRYAVVSQIQVKDQYPAHFQEMQSLKRLNMRGSTVTDFAPIQLLGGLEQIDLRENYAFDATQHEVLSMALPDCDIRWSVPVDDAYFDSHAPSVDLASLNLSTDQLRRLLAEYPDKAFDYQVPLYGKRYAPDTESLDLRGETPDAGVVDDALGLLPKVTSVDLRGVAASSQTVSMLCDAHPEVRFMFTCDVPQGEMTTEDTEITVEGTYEDLLAYLAYMDYMPNLQSIDANAIALTDEQVDSISDAAKSGKLKYSLNVFGVQVNSLATELNLDNVRITSVEEVEKVLSRLPNLQKVSMCDCGMSESQMGQLFDAHPDIKFVWWLEFGHYRLRTDATAFTTALGTGNRYGYDDTTFAPIRYCTDLMMLDLGHNHIKSLENFRGLKKLRVLIMADNELTDIAPIAEFQDLEYCELFLNDIADLTPLTGLKKLVDLNVFYNPLYDNYKVLESMTWLERLWIGGCRLSREDVKELRAALSNTKINIEGRGSTGHGWRSHPHYDILKRMYEEERYIPFE